MYMAMRLLSKPSTAQHSTVQTGSPYTEQCQQSAAILEMVHKMLKQYICYTPHASFVIGAPRAHYDQGCSCQAMRSVGVSITLRAQPRCSHGVGNQGVTSDPGSWHACGVSMHGFLYVLSVEVDVHLIVHTRIIIACHTVHPSCTPRDLNRTACIHAASLQKDAGKGSHAVL